MTRKYIDIMSPIDGSYDQVARECFKQNPSSCIGWILAASYAYYWRFSSLLNDSTYDKMMKYVLDNYDKLEHPHKHLLTKDMLKAGTAYNLGVKDYPSVVVVTVERMIEKLEEGM